MHYVRLLFAATPMRDDRQLHRIVFLFFFVLLCSSSFLLMFKLFFLFLLLIILKTAKNEMGEKKYSENTHKQFDALDTFFFHLCRFSFFDILFHFHGILLLFFFLYFVDFIFSLFISISFFLFISDVIHS